MGGGIGAVRIVSVEMAGFRRHAGPATYHLDAPRVIVRGDNGKGKTTIAEAITYALFGTDLSGSPRVDRLIHQGAKGMEVAVVVRTADGAEHEVRRSRRGRSSDLRLDGRPATQAEVERVVGPARYWLPVFWPATLAGWSDSEAREFFAGLLPPVDPAAVLEALGPAHADILRAVDLRRPDQAAQTIRAQVRDLERELERLQGRIDALREAAGAPVPEVTAPDVAEELASCLRELDALVVPDTAAMEVEARRLAETVARAKAEIASLTAAMEDPEAIADACPTCGQPLPAAERERARAAIEERNAERRARLQAVVAQGREAAARLKVLEGQIGALRQRGAAARREELARRVETLRRQHEERRLQERLRAEALARRQQAERDLADTEAAIRDREAVLGQHRQELDALRDYVAKAAELQVAALERHLNRVSVQLYEVAKTTGEVRPVFRLLWDGRPMAVLSTSERIRVGLEVAGLVNRLTGLDYPVFIDNAESITSFDPPAASQVIVARVEAGAELAVELAEGAVIHG